MHSMPIAAKNSFRRHVMKRARKLALLTYTFAAVIISAPANAASSDARIAQLAARISALDHVGGSSCTSAFPGSADRSGGNACDRSRQ